MADSAKLLAFLEGSGLSYRQNSVSFIFDCPRCRKKSKLYIRKRDGRYICWFCAEIDGYQGRPEYALADLTSTPVSLVKEQLYGPSLAGDENYFDLQLPDFFGEDDDRDEEADVFETKDLPWDFFQMDHPFALRGLQYLESRGISRELAIEYGLRYAPKDRRVIFPVKLGDRVVGWQARTVANHRAWNEEKQDFIEFPKMLSSKGIPMSRTVMFANRLCGSRHVVVCEGPVDAIKAHLCGGNVATMGKAIGPGQVRAIRDPERLSRRDVGQLVHAGIERVYLALDPDAARETTRLVREFSDLEVFVMHAPAPYKDLGAMSLDGVRELFVDARRVTSANLFVHFDVK